MSRFRQWVFDWRIWRPYFVIGGIGVLAQILVVLWALLAHAGTSDTVEAVPGPPFGASATFLSDLQTFLRFEDGARYAEMFQGFVVKGCLGTVSPNLTHTPTGLAGKCVAYPGGLRIVEAGSITYLDNSVCYAIVHRDITGNVTGPDSFLYTRVPGTHYAVNCTAPSLPQTPANATLVMKVTTTTGAITAVTDIRQFSPIQLRKAGQIGAGLPPSNNCLPGDKVCTDGTGCVATGGICDGAITTPKIANGAVTEPKLYVAPSTTRQIVIPASVSTTSLERDLLVFLPGPTAGGLVWIGGSVVLTADMTSTSGNQSITWRLYRDGVVIQTSLQSLIKNDGAATIGVPITLPSWSDQPTAGIHTYKVTIQASGSGTLQVFTGTTPGQAFLMVLP